MHEDEGRWGTVSEAAQVFKVSVNTIRRRMKRGELEARREQTPQGFRWLIRLPDEESPASPQNAPGSPQTAEMIDHGSVVMYGPDAHDMLIDTLQHELELRNQEVARLHDVIAQQAQAIERATAALTAGSSATTPPPPADPPVQPEARRGFCAWLLELEGESDLPREKSMAIPTLETPRLILRAFSPDDWEAHNAMLSDTDAMQYMHFRSWNDVQRRQWFDACIAAGQLDTPEGGMNWIIERKETGEVIGWFGMGATADPVNTYDISFGYALARDHWNQGYMTEVLRGVFVYALETLGLPQLSANCHTPNVASARAMEKAGMRHTHSDDRANSEGNRSHRHHYCITRGEWEAQR